jgi:hypothetical protein
MVAELLGTRVLMVSPERMPSSVPDDPTLNDLLQGRSGINVVATGRRDITMPSPNVGRIAFPS